MTDRLSALLHQEVDHIDVPVPPVHEALEAGRRLRRRRRIGQGLAVVAAVTAIGVGTALVAGTDDRPDPTGRTAVDQSPVTGDPVDLGPVFASGDTVYLDRGRKPVRLPEVVQSIYYTSAGLLLRTNETGASDGGAPFHFALVRADGTVEQVDLTLGEVVVATDPRQPYLAFAEADGDDVQVVVHDVSTDAEVARVDVPDFQWSGGWAAPPVALAGERVYVGGTTTAVVDWQTGEIDTTDLVDPVWPQGGGRAMVRADDGPLEIVDVATGERLVSVPGLESPWGSISPDGRWAIVFDQLEERDFEVYALDEGTHITIDAYPWEFAWTAGGDLYSVDKNGLHECDTGTGECVDSQLPDGVVLGDFVRLGGKAYES